jgi:hypothetical protein
MVVTTSPLPPITPLPVLIRSSDRLTLDGVGTVFTKDTEITGLHVVTTEEASLRLDKWERTDPERWQLVTGVVRLQQALRENDRLLFQQAIDAVQRWIPHFGGSAEIAHIRSSAKWKKEAAWSYSGLMSNLLQTARFIIWYSPKDEKPRPGLFCPNWEVAVYAVAGMDQVRKCAKPGCEIFFIPEQDTHAYCKPAHGNAHRVARWKTEHKKHVGGRK